MTSADLCRRNGWGPGTVIQGDEGYGMTVLEITAVGKNAILAKTISHNGIPRVGNESPWNLSFRKWKEVR